MCAEFDRAFLVPKIKKGRPYSNTYRLWRKGYRIGGKTAWRLTTKEFLPEYALKSCPKAKFVRHHSKYRLGLKWIDFGNDPVWLRQKNGELKKYRRVWWMPFLVDAWMGQKFNDANTINWLRKKCGLQVALNLGRCRLKWAALNNWKDVKDYLMKVHKVNLEEYFTRHDRNTKFAETVRDSDDGSLKMSERLEAANLVGRELGRIIAIEAEAERRSEAEAEADKTKNLFLEKLEKIAEANAESN